MVYLKHLRCRSFSSEDLCFAAGQRVFLRCYWLLISQICTWLQDPCGVTILPQRPDHVKNVSWGCFRFAKNKYSPNSRIKCNWLVKSHLVSEVSFFSFALELQSERWLQVKSFPEDHAEIFKSIQLNGERTLFTHASSVNGWILMENIILKWQIM